MQYILSEQEYNNLINNNSKNTQNIHNKSIHNNINNDSITFSREKAMQILCCLGSAIYNGNYNYDKKQRYRLIEMSSDLSWDIAEKYNLDINEGFIDIDTLEFKEFKELED